MSKNIIQADIFKGKILDSPDEVIESKKRIKGVDAQDDEDLVTFRQLAEEVSNVSSSVTLEKTGVDVDENGNITIVAGDELSESAHFINVMAENDEADLVSAFGATYNFTKQRIEGLYPYFGTTRIILINFI